MKDIKEVNKILQDHEKRIRVLETRELPVKKGVSSETIGTSDSNTLILDIINLNYTTTNIF